MAVKNRPITINWRRLGRRSPLGNWAARNHLTESNWPQIEAGEAITLCSVRIPPVDDVFCYGAEAELECAHCKRLARERGL